MFASIVRIAMLVSLIFGGYKLYPKVKPSLEPIIGNPQIMGMELMAPLIDTINQALPDNLKIPLPTKNKSTADGNQDTNNGQVSGAETSTNSSNLSNLTNTIINSVKQQAADLAQDQIDTAKKEAGKAFCQVLIERVKSECGQ